jgi:Winged helix-turn helix
LNEAACAFLEEALEEALEQGPQAYGLPVTIWSIWDLQVLVLRESGITVSICTLHRGVHALGYRYRRPRHDLRHRQDAEAVAAAKRVLDWLKKTVLSPNDPIWNDSIWVYLDECEIHTHPSLANVWRRQGQPMRIPAAGEDQKCAVFGAVEYASGQVIFQSK